MPGRNFKVEIESARNDPAQLRKIANEIQTNGGSRLLMIRALHLAKVAETGPHPLGKVSAELGLPRPTGLPLYRYKLAPEIFQHIQGKLSSGLPSDRQRPLLAPAFVLWAADWFRQSYRGSIQRWGDIENVLGLKLPQSEWRKLADEGFHAWGIAPLVTAHGNLRLSNLARHGGFPAAAILNGASWPKKFLERVVGELLGADIQEIGAAIAICERNDYFLPASWRSQEMYAICGELALKIVALRAFADEDSPADGRPYSARLDEICEDWRDELPMTLDGAAADLIDALLETGKLSGNGSIRVGRVMHRHGEAWRECLDFHLDGRWDDKGKLLSSGQHVRIFLQPADALADRISGRLAYLEHETANCWIARAMRSEAAIPFPFDLPVSAEFHTHGERLTRSFIVPGGKPVSDGLRVFERRTGSTHQKAFSLIGQGSGGYKAEPVFVDVPQEWSVRGKDGNSEIEIEDFAFAPGRRLYRCMGQIIAQKDNGDKFLIRTGQNADRRDRLSIIANAVSGVQPPDGEQVFKHPLHARVSDGLSDRVASLKEVRWRLVGQRDWCEDLAKAGPGLCEFAWLDGATGHLRDRQTAFVLPAGFAITQQTNGTYADIQLSGWSGTAVLGDEAPDSTESRKTQAWKVRIDPPRKALLTLRLTSGQGATFAFKVPIAAKEWLTTWEGDLLPRNTILGLADLRGMVARTPSTATLMGEVVHSGGAALDARWKIDRELGLSALRTDIAALIRPLGIDTQVRLYFHNGSSDHWYVTEFGNSLEWEPNGGLYPKTAIIGEDIRICGRFLGAPEKEVDLGDYHGLPNGPGGQSIHLPRLQGPWLVYLREGSRVLTRPKFVSGDLEPEAPRHRLGQAMAQPIDLARADLQSLVEEISLNPETQEARQTLRIVMALALSLNGLPPQTFEIFSKFDHAGALVPLLLYRCEEQYLSTILELFDGLCSSWVLLPHTAWDKAFQTQGACLVRHLDDPQWALTMIRERQDEIIARAPQLRPLICRNFVPETWGEIHSHFIDHTCEDINTDTGAFNPFRPAFQTLLPKKNFLEPLMRVFDAPFAAALAAMGRITLSKIQILTVKDVERRHPAYFAKAYGYALTEIKNGR